MDQSLNVFTEVADTRNFSRAAERLHMTQPAVSQHIRTLEERLKVRLLERNNKSVTLTRAGEIVLHHAKEIGGLYRRMEEMVDELMHYTGGPLAIGASYTFGEYVLPSTLARLSEQFPAIRPAVTIGNTADIAEQVRNRVLDVGIVEGEEIGTGLSIERLAEDEMFVAAGAGHPLSGHSVVSIRSLEEQTWLVREKGSGTRAAADKLFAELSIHPERLLEMGSTQSIKETVEAGLGVTLQSRWALRKELGLGSLILLPVEGLPFKRGFHILLRHGDLRTRTIEMFLQTLRSMTSSMLSPAD
ncbi:LysR family transcriptional regulator [Cohnella endophytica]|uniref:LysR family transcriptional regulator n=1 Tax=Cohnella endophytica TaxID=2419778 RepID=A0A494X9B4_9BACL|nr:LysR family transcriptional regulator [Cohnella endophytica]RKP47337.1 LysR family transcriptional regulator [Cohnella endophytica]